MTQPADYPEFTGCILFCPVCCTNDDAEQWGENEMQCNNCETQYTVTVEPSVVAQHSTV